MHFFEKKFNLFLEHLKNDENSALVDTIKFGFKSINEALSTDDANPKKMGQPVRFAGDPSNETTIYPNMDNEYFSQTLSDKMMEIVNAAQAGNRVWYHPKAGKWVVSHDPLKSGHSSYQNANFSSPSGWAGGSGGYSLGGPTQGSSLANL